MTKISEKAFKNLIDICARLRSDDGCMWERKQDHSSLLPCLTEEAAEVKDAIIKKDMNNLCEELGDLLYQVVFHAQIASENKEFTIEDVVKGITDKIIRRHPHVFSDEKVSSVQEIIENWDKIKKKEKEE